MTQPTAEALVEDWHEGLFADTATATFSKDRVYRYALTRRWGPSPSPDAVFIMLNPSIADAVTTDPTLRRCVSFARQWSCAGLVVLNLFALRATNPAELYRHPEPVGLNNDRVIAERLAELHRGPVVCAWGRQSIVRGRARQVEDMLRARDVKPLCLGLTVDRHPRHPLYVRGDAIPFEYEGRPS